MQATYKKSVSWRLTVGNCSVQLWFLCRFGEFGKMPLIHFLPLRSVSVPPRCAAKMGNGKEIAKGEKIYNFYQYGLRNTMQVRNNSKLRLTH